MSGYQSIYFILKGHSFCREVQSNICVGGALYAVCCMQCVLMVNLVFSVNLTLCSV